MAIKLTTAAQNDRADRIRIAAKYCGVELEEARPTFPLNDSEKAKSIFGRVPYAEIEDGRTLFESLSILYYVAGIKADLDLLGKSHFDKANVLKWFSIVESDLHRAMEVMIYPKYIPHIYKLDEAAEKEWDAKVTKWLTVMDEYLAAHTYLVSERLTAADIAVVPTLKVLLEHCVSKSTRESLPHLMRWFNTCAAKENFASVLGEVTLPEKTISELRGEATAEKAPAAPPADTAAKDTAAAPAAAPADETAAPAADAAPAKKPKHPLDLLEPSTMVMDEWKRQYSNNDTREVALPWLWKNFDKNGYTLWFCKYKYNDELSKTFMAANLITGWFQRVDHVRKYMFGNVHVFGVSGQRVEISGVWMIRGNMEPTDENMMGDMDASHFDWRKLDVDDAADKALINDYFAWDGEFKGGSECEFNQGKTFK